MESAGSSVASSNHQTAASRQQRGAIATQACETCRSRKQKCDEARPKCSLCQRMKLDCRYREPQPTKKDRTLVEILERLKSLEGKVDRIPLRGLNQAGSGPPQHSPSSQNSYTVDADPNSSATPDHSRLPSYQPSPGRGTKSQPYRHASAAHKMLTWPAIQQLLIQAVPSNVGDMKSLEQEGSAFIVRLHQGQPVLPLDECLEERAFVGMQTTATRATGGHRVTFPELTHEVMQRLADAYFDSFNMIHPFMDRQNFMSDTLAMVQTEGFDEETQSVLALLVFALGELAIEGATGIPIARHNGRDSGLRGGSSIKPPGLSLFNEARKRLGFVLTKCNLENVQIFSLAALYYENCSRHLDFWRLTVSASQACQIMVTCNTIDWNSPQGDLTKRAYWHCVLMETGLHLELDLPLTGIMALEPTVPLPSFDAAYCEADHRGNQASHFEAHYASQLALRRLCADLHNAINDSMRNPETSSSTNSEDFVGATPSVLKQLDSRLTQWRGLLPSDLQWSDQDSAAFPGPQPTSPASTHSLDPELSPQRFSRAGRSLFTTDLDREPVHYMYLYDVQVALLRTRYYYAKYMVYRPFVFKALHYPEMMSQQDAEGVAECLRTCLKWPITLSPTSRRKRLIPYLFCWSQNFLGILLILHMTRHNTMLRDIRAQLCGEQFETEVEESIALMLDWIRDLKSSDPIATWCWNIVSGIYNVK